MDWGDSHAELWLPMALMASRIDTPRYAVMQTTTMAFHPMGETPSRDDDTLALGA